MGPGLGREFGHTDVLFGGADLPCIEPQDIYPPVLGHQLLHLVVHERDEVLPSLGVFSRIVVGVAIDDVSLFSTGLRRRGDAPPGRLYVWIASG